MHPYTAERLEKPQVAVYLKLEENVWRMTTYLGLDKIVRFDSIDVELPMSEIYLDVELGERVKEWLIHKRIVR